MDKLIFNQICASIIAQPEQWSVSPNNYYIKRNDLCIWIANGISFYKITDPVERKLSWKQRLKLHRIINKWKDLKIKEALK